MAAYKASEKRWRPLSEAQIRQDPQLLDVLCLSPEQQRRVRSVGTWQWTPESPKRPILTFDGFGDKHSGFYVIPNAIDAKTQLQVAHACLTEYCEAPHVTNMHCQNEQVAEIWKKARESHPSDPAKSPLLSKLHWAASGHHYEWTARKYYKENFSPVPPFLEKIAVQCAEACGMTIAAEAVIVNFYKKTSKMGGHQDDVEYTMDHPVISLSLGSSSIFLKGTTTKEDPPLEVLLRSGDLAVLGGNSRLSYHGVAKVLPVGTFDVPKEQWEALVEGKSSEEQDEYAAVQKYLGANRININVRQVYPLEKTEASDSVEEEAPSRKRTRSSSEGETSS
uniref:Fe2OG dioxygenase domain-containing protein n=1 Tax=Globisporangium ultimum (strain ATCC 200006 / CBS 805.95 / DAOM BR144) TaxID=431595 RepID=K3XAB6_GLOUD